MSNESLTLLEAVGIYTGSLKKGDNHEIAHRELHRFVQWCGPERVFSEIAPPEIGAYADQMTGSGTTPQASERLLTVRKFLSYSKKKGYIERNLAQHVRVRKSKSRASTAKAKDTQEYFEMTAEGHARILEQLEKLKADRAPIALQIREAAADKDVRENVPLEAAREQLGHIESRIREIESTLRSSVIVDPSQRRGSKIAKVGAKVSIQDLSTGRKNSYTLVGRTEANPSEGKISDVSPLGKALIGHAVGHEVEAQTPRGMMRYRILNLT